MSEEQELSKQDMRQLIKDKLKKQKQRRTAKKGKTSYKESSSNTRLTDYDLLPAEEQDKFFAADGSCLFLEMTGESNYPQFIIDRAFDLYFDGLTIDSIAAKWNIPATTVAGWNRKQHWQEKIDKFKSTVDEEYTKEKVKEEVTKRKQIDERHEQTLNWLWTEIQWEMMSPMPEALKGNDKAEFNFEVRRNLRMKTWQVAVNCYKTLIDTERTVTGLDQPEEYAHELPSEFNLTLALPDGTVLPNLDALRSVLPSQNPFEYDQTQGNAPLALPDAREGIQNTNQIQTPNPQQQMSSEPIPSGERLKPHEPVVINPVVIPRPGMNTVPPPENHVKPHPLYGYLDMGYHGGI